MLDFPNMEKCDTDEWDAIVDKFIKVAKKYKMEVSFLHYLIQCQNIFVINV